MSFHRIKLLAAAIMLTGGLGMGLGTTWLANAQDQAKPKSNPTETEFNKAATRLLSFHDADVAAKDPKKWDYHYIPAPGHSVTPDGFEKQIEQMEKDGWTYLGQVAMQVVLNPKIGKVETAPTHVFRRPVKVLADIVRMAIPDQPNAASGQLLTQLYGDVTKSSLAPMDYKGSYSSALELLDKKNAKIAELEAQIARLKGESANEIKSISIQQKDLPLGVSELQDVLSRVGSKIGIKNLQIKVTADDGGTIQLVGPKDSVEWAKRLIQTLSGTTTDPVKPVKP